MIQWGVEMKIEFKQYDTLPCEVEKFEINGVKADINDFGFPEIIMPDLDELGDAMYWGCGDRIWFTWELEECESWEPILKKYSITKEELQEITDMLERKLSISNCGWCI